MSLDPLVSESPPVTGIDELAAWFAGAGAPPGRAGRSAWSTRRCRCAPARSTRSPTTGPAGSARRWPPSPASATSRSWRTGASSPPRAPGSPSPSSRAARSSSPGRPFADVHVVAAELDRHLEKCRAIAGDLGLEMLATGYRPWGTPRTVPWMPKNRYGVMRPYLAARGRLAEDMMAMTGSTQASFDFSGRARHGREAPGGAGRPAGRHRALRQLAGGGRPPLGLEVLPGGGLGGGRPGPLAACCPSPSSPGFEERGLRRLRRLGPRRAHDLPPARRRLPATRAASPSAASWPRGCTASGPP